MLIGQLILLRLTIQFRDGWMVEVTQLDVNVSLVGNPEARLLIGPWDHKARAL